MILLTSLFEEMLGRGASDLHLEQGQMAKLRVHGELVPVGTDILSREFLSSALQEICESNLWKKFESCGDIDFAYEYEDIARFRSNVFRQFFGLGAVFRVIPTQIRSLTELGAPDALRAMANLRSGLVLVTGPTGSGKSTTLASMVNEINLTRAVKIVTIEEPVEFVHQGKSATILHREVGVDTQSFSSGLRTAMKSDCNVILVGEMRDRETIELALNASEMGMLVFGTLHTNSAAKTIDRVVDAFPAKQKSQIRSVLANSLKGVVAQQLLRSADGSRRWPAFEILLGAQALPGIIRSGELSKLTTLMQTSKQAGMITLDEYLVGLLRAGKISKDSAYQCAQDKVAFSKFI